MPGGGPCTAGRAFSPGVTKWRKKRYLLPRAALAIQAPPAGPGGAGHGTVLRHLAELKAKSFHFLNRAVAFGFEDRLSFGEIKPPGRAGMHPGSG